MLLNPNTLAFVSLQQSSLLSCTHYKLATICDTHTYFTLRL